MKKSNYFIMLAMLMLASCASQNAAENSAGSLTENTAEETADASVEVAESTSGNDPDELICRREQVTGSNFRRRVCMTRAERNRERADVQNEVLLRRSADRGQ